MQLVLEEAFVQHGSQLGLGLVDRAKFKLVQFGDGSFLRHLTGRLNVLAQVVGAPRPVLLLVAWVPMSAQPASSRHSAHHIPVDIVLIVLLPKLGAVRFPLILILDESTGHRSQSTSLRQSLGRLVNHPMVNAVFLSVNVAIVWEELGLSVRSAGPAVVEKLMRLLLEIFKLAARADSTYDLIVELLFR